MQCDRPFVVAGSPRLRFAPTAEELANFVRQKREEDSQWTLYGPLSKDPPPHAAVACMAVMPRKGLHLVPYNLTDILQLPSCQDVDRMYDPDESFVLEKLLEAVRRERPDLAVSTSFHWRELKWEPQYHGFLRPRKEGGKKGAKEGSGGKEAGRVVTTTINTTSSPPCRPWRKKVSGSAISSPQQQKWQPHAMRSPLPQPPPRASKQDQDDTKRRRSPLPSLPGEVVGRKRRRMKGLPAMGPVEGLNTQSTVVIPARPLRSDSGRLRLVPGASGSFLQPFSRLLRV